MYVYPGDSWTLTRKLKYVAGKTWSSFDYGAYVRANNNVAIVTSPAVRVELVAPTISSDGVRTDGHVSVSFDITDAHAKNILYQVSIVSNSDAIINAEGNSPAALEVIDVNKAATTAGKYYAVLISDMYLYFFGRRPELGGFSYWLNRAVTKGFTEAELAREIYQTGVAVIGGSNSLVTDWTTWDVIEGASNWYPSGGGVVVVADNSPSNPTLTIGDHENNTQEALDYIAVHKNATKDGKFYSVLIHEMYQSFFGRSPELDGFYFWLKDAITKNWTEYTLANTIYKAGLAYIGNPTTEADLWNMWVPLLGATEYVSDGGTVTVTSNGVAVPTIAVAEVAVDTTASPFTWKKIITTSGFVVQTRDTTAEVVM